jgi:hypothetical protein
MKLLNTVNLHTRKFQIQISSLIFNGTTNLVNSKCLLQIHTPVWQAVSLAVCFDIENELKFRNSGETKSFTKY